MTTALAVLALHAPGALRGAWYVHRDSLEYTYAQDQVLREAVAARRLPHLNDDILGGVPHLADPPTQALYPPRWLTLPWPQPAATHLFVLGHALLAGLGAAALARGLGAGQGGQALAGAAFPASGFVMSLQENLPLLAGAAWTACALAFALRVSRARDLRASLRPAVGLAMSLGACLLAGDPQAAAVAGALGPLVALASAAPGRRGGAAAAAAAAVVAGAGLAAAVLVPASALLPYTTRSIDFPYALASLWSTSPWRAVEALVPWPWTSDFPALTFAGRGLLEGDRTTFLCETLYVGPLLLLLAALGLRGGERARARRLLAVVAVGCVVLALGRHTPVHGLACAALPGLARLRYPEKFLLVPTLVACALAARGASTLRTSGAAPGVVAAALGGLALIVVPPLAPALVAASATTPWDAGLIRAQLDAGATRAVVVLGLAGAAIVLGARAARAASTPAQGRRLQRVALGAVLLVAALDPLLASRARLFLADRSPFDPPPEATLRARAALAPAPGADVPGRLALWPPALSAPAGAPGEPAQAALRRAIERGAAAPRFGVRSLQGFASWHPRRLAAFAAATHDRPDRAWALLGVQRVLAAAGAAPPGVVPGAGEVVGPAGVALHVPARPGPVAWLVARATTARASDQAQALALLARDGFDPSRHAVLEGAPTDAAPLAVGSAWPAAQVPAGEVTARRPGPGAGELEVAVRTAAPATLLVASLHFPGWEATVDGAPAEVHAASGLILGVPVPAGDHRVVLRYRTPGFAAGLTLSSITGLLLVGALVAGRRGRRPPPAPA